MTRALHNRLVELGAGPRHRQAVLRAWLGGRPVTEAQAVSRETLGHGLLTALPALEAELEGLARVASAHPSSDGSTRLLVRLADGRSVESVLLQRGRVCVSTQVGCAVGCGFCKTGEGGLLRNLDAIEILAQVALARRRSDLRGVVLMGMGEPAHNLDAVQEALAVLGTEGGFGHKALVFSTVGDGRVFDRLLAGEVKPALALSLHTTRPDLRRELLPRAAIITPRELVGLACDYSRRVGHPLQVQWTLLADVNDGQDELERLALWLQGERAIVNFIPYNHVDGAGWRRPDEQRTVALVRGLRRRGVAATIRRSGGQDVDGACGQLRARHATAGA